MDILIRRATADDCTTIADIGRAAVRLSHLNSCPETDMNSFLATYYNEAAILEELMEPTHIYHLLIYGGQPAGFSKIILNATHPNIPQTNATKLDRIYLDSKFYDLKLGYHLLNHNIALSKENDQCGMWLFTWTGNLRAVNFYRKNGFVVVGSHKFKVSETHYNAHHQMFLEYRK
jgi:ribosomal protein S18 acetylase RimI-like enzyme